MGLFVYSLNMKNNPPSVKSDNQITVHIIDRKTRGSDKEILSLYPKETVDMEAMEERKFKLRPTENFSKKSATTVHS